MTATQPTDEAEAAKERRGLLAAGALFFGALVVLVAIAMLASGDAGDARTSATVATTPCPEGDTACERARASADLPSIIPKPGSGAEPEDPGDRGGWEQLALLGVIVVAIGGITAFVVVSTRRTQRDRRGTPPVA